MNKPGKRQIKKEIDLLEIRLEQWRAVAVLSKSYEVSSYIKIGGMSVLLSDNRLLLPIAENSIDEMSKLITEKYNELNDLK